MRRHGVECPSPVGANWRGVAETRSRATFTPMRVTLRDACGPPACHSQGIAGRILRQPRRHRREKGVGQFEADVLPQNKAMLDWGIRPLPESQGASPLTQRRQPQTTGKLHVRIGDPDRTHELTRVAVGPGGISPRVLLENHRSPPTDVGYPVQGSRFTSRFRSVTFSMTRWKLGLLGTLLLARSRTLKSSLDEAGKTPPFVPNLKSACASRR